VLEDDLQAAEAVLRLLCESFKQVNLLSGNHDTRLIRCFGGEVSTARLYKLLGCFDNFKTTGRFFVHVNGWKFVHPRQYSKIRVKLAQDLAQRWQMNIATGHQHHSGRTVSICGKFEAVDIGCLVDLNMQDYTTYEAGTYAAPLNGFAVLDGPRLQLFDKFTPWNLFGLPDLDDT
jgi:DNA repair exonuclease SbcCD nuclease subunit